MKYLRRQVRKAFLGTSWVLAYFVYVLIKHPEWAVLHGEVRYYGLLTACALLALLYTAAVLTTSKPSPYRNNWAVAASSLSLILGFFQAYLYRTSPDNLRAELSSLVVILLGVAGLYFYAPGGSPSESEAADKPVASAESIQPDLEPSAPLIVRKPSSTPTEIAPSLLMASSPELAAAAASPADPNAPWDPLAFIRTPETLQKVRG
jgi:hypothetical protein